MAPPPESAARLRLAAFCFAMTFGLVFLARPRIGAPAGLDVALGAAMVSAGAVSAVVILGTLRLRDPQRVAALGLGFEILACLIVALAEHWPPWPPSPVVRGVSWTCLLLVLFPWIVPAPPRRVAAVALLAASTSPAALYLSAVRGNPLPPLQAQAALLLPPYLCAGVAVLLAQRLGALGGTREGGRIGAFELVARIGEGGMGEVWRARHALLKRPAAVKLVRPQELARRTGEDPHVVFRRFAREAQATAQLSSVHTVNVFDYGYTPDGAFYYAMELLEGIDLETLVRTHGPQPPARVAAILLQVADSLAEAHEQGLVHRDVKPANIHLCRLGTRRDVVKVLDFGLVVTAEDAETRMTRLTHEGLASGTPAYMAPEMATRGSLDARADLYGLGCVAYYALTGSLVFSGKSPMQVLKDHVKTPPEPPSQRLGVRLPEALEGLVLACLEKHPDQRPASAAAFAARLDETGLAAAWTAEAAAEWWSAHAPRVDPEPAA